jgi:phage replication O-like protein O
VNEAKRSPTTCSLRSLFKGFVEWAKVGTSFTPLKINIPERKTMEFEVNNFQVPNAFIDEVICDLTGVELKIYLLIVRKTIGLCKEKEAISINDFCEILKISNRHVIKGCNSLAEKGLIKAIKKDKKTTVFSIPYKEQK